MVPMMEKALLRIPLLGASLRWLRNRLLPKTSPSRPSPARRVFWEQVALADLIISGGGLIPAVAHIEWARSNTLRRCREMNKPVILHGQTIYRENDPEAPYRWATCIVVRDAGESRRRAESCGVPPMAILDGVDPALLLPAAEPDRLNEFLSRNALRPGQYVAVNLRSGLSQAQISRIRDFLTGCHASQPSLRFLFFGMQSHQSEDDALAIKAFLRHVPNLDPVCIPGWTDPGLLKAVLGAAAFNLATRYHAAVFALSSGIAALGVSISPEYDLKLSGIFNQFSHPEWFYSHLDDRPLQAPSPDASGLAASLSRLAPRAGLLCSCVNDIMKLKS